ncbi:hypothetical protein [Actinocorallia sp. A-T 12471]|uniref:hypothetical protein n=1 Tax=Actinocorallia sp. A-T 12471 TaxID=3089813 RepID=UPI0029CBFB88|nr:hypothetical protein [Actinocorallia sp. A-T 12471]MDX6741326.1 hypothetical protein [Actinocorallia sp. A-T 12471]
MREELGVVEFQLYLLKTMMPPAAALVALLERFQKSEIDLNRASERVSKLLRPRFREPGPAPAMSEDVARMLEGAAVLSPAEYSGDGQWYRFPVWPEFVFHMTFEDSLGFLNVAEFRWWPSARDGNRNPEVWHFLESDLKTHFDEIKEIDVWGHYRSYTGRSLTDGHEYFLRFGYALLQEITHMGQEDRCSFLGGASRSWG